MLLREDLLERRDAPKSYLCTPIAIVPT